MRSTKNSILKSITLCSIIAFMYGWMKIDEYFLFGAIACLTSALWLGLYLYVNVFLYVTEKMEREANEYSR